MTTTVPAPPLLRLAVATAVVQTAVVVSWVVGWSPRHPPLLVLSLTGQLVFCRGVLRRGPGSAMGLLLWQASTLAALVRASGLPPGLRIAGLISTMVVIGGLVKSLWWFPPPTLPTDVPNEPSEDP